MGVFTPASKAIISKIYTIIFKKKNQRSCCIDGAATENMSDSDPVMLEILLCLIGGDINPFSVQTTFIHSNKYEEVTLAEGIVFLHVIHADSTAQTDPSADRPGSRSVVDPRPFKLSAAGYLSIPNIWCQ